MNAWKLGAAAALAVGGMVWGLAGRAPAAAPEVTWLGDWEAAKAASRETGKPILVAFR